MSRQCASVQSNRSVHILGCTNNNTHLHLRKQLGICVAIFESTPNGDKKQIRKILDLGKYWGWSELGRGCPEGLCNLSVGDTKILIGLTLRSLSNFEVGSNFKAEPALNGDLKQVTSRGPFQSKSFWFLFTSFSLPDLMFNAIVMKSTSYVESLTLLSLRKGSDSEFLFIIPPVTSHPYTFQMKFNCLSHATYMFLL